MAKNSPAQISIDAATDAPVDTSNGLLCAPQSVEPFGEILIANGHSAAYSAARRILQNMGTTLTAAKLAEKSVREYHHGQRLEQAGMMQQGTIDPAKVDAYGKALEVSFSRAGQVLDKNKIQIVDTLRALDNQIKIKTTDTERNSASRALESESVRSHMRSLKPAERSTWAAQQITEGNAVEVFSIINSPAISSGLTAAQLGTLKSLAQNKFSPTESATRDATGRLLDHIDRASQDFVGQWKRLLPRKTAPTLAGALEALRNGPAEKRPKS